MFLEKLEEPLYAINQVSTNCCILGDINIDLLKPQELLTIEYTNILHRNTFTSQISKPTRITNTSSTIIDHILINNCNVSVMRTRHLGTAKRARTIRAKQKGRREKGHRAKRAQSQKCAEQKGREITMLHHRYIQGRNFFR